MKLATHPALDALVAHYVLGTLRGLARARFARAIREEPLVAHRVEHWLARANLKPSTAQAVQPSPNVWKRIERDLNLAQYRAPWFTRLNIWRNWAIAATLAAVVLIAVNVGTLVQRDDPQSISRAIASLKSETAPTVVEARLSQDGRTLTLKADRAVIASREQSYELWLLPATGAAPISLAVLGSLDASFALPSARIGQLAAGAKLAVSVEPAGGSRTGAPTGPVILVGAIES
jgi:anti-sigma-K factor RskA